MRAAILGMGEWWPETIRTNDAWPKDFGAQAAASAHRELTDIAVANRGDRCEAIVARHLAAEAHDPFLHLAESQGLDAAQPDTGAL